jgi:hypothetical protein
MRNLFGIPLPERKGMKKGGSAIPRNTVIANEPHHLAYINEEEDKMLRDAGGSGIPGPGGVPAFANVRIVDEYGVAHSVDRKEAADFQASVDYGKSLLAAASSGDFSGFSEPREAAGQASQIVSRLDMGEEAFADKERRNNRQEENRNKQAKARGVTKTVLPTVDTKAKPWTNPNTGAVTNWYTDAPSDTGPADDSFVPITETDLKDAQEEISESIETNRDEIENPISADDSAAVIQDLEDRGITSNWDLAKGDARTDDMSPEQIASALDNYVGDSQLVAGEQATSGGKDIERDNITVTTDDLGGFKRIESEVVPLLDAEGKPRGDDVWINPDTKEPVLIGDGLVSGGDSEENSGNPLGAIDWVNDEIDEGYANALAAGTVSAETDPANSDKNGLLNQVANMPGYVGAAGQFIGGLLQSLGGTAPSDKLVTTVDGKQVFEKAGGGYYAVNAVGLPFDIEGGGSDGKGLPTSISMSEDSGFKAPPGFKDLTEETSALNNESDDNEVTLETVGEVDEVDEVSCPEGHVYDSAQEMCVLDPFQQEWGEADYDAAAASVAPTNVYTAATVPENAFKALQPGIINESPAFVLPTLNTTAADLTVGTQATDPIPGAGEATDQILGAHVMPDDWRTRPIGSQAGLAALNLDPRLASNMRETQTDMTNRFSNNASFLG